MSDAVLHRLALAIPNPRTELRHESAFQLVIATILSAQATDKRINQVTPVLFARWPTPADLAAASQEDVEEVVRSTGFFRNKARRIREASQVLVDRFDGEVPRTMAEILELPGVARKTANVVLGCAHGVAAGIAVDTHVKRVAARLGLTDEVEPDRVEADLCARFPREDWTAGGHRLLLHGRYLCTARNPDCAACPLNELCPSAEADPLGSWEVRARGEEARVEDGLAASLG